MFQKTTFLDITIINLLEKPEANVSRTLGMYVFYALKMRKELLGILSSCMHILTLLTHHAVITLSEFRVN